MKKFLSLILVLGLSACAAQYQVTDGETAEETAVTTTPESTVEPGEETEAAEGQSAGEAEAEAIEAEAVETEDPEPEEAPGGEEAEE